MEFITSLQPLFLNNSHSYNCDGSILSPVATVFAMLISFEEEEKARLPTRLRCWNHLPLIPKPPQASGFLHRPLS